MPRPSERTRSRKRAFKPLPSGKMGRQFKRSVGAPLRCRHCGQQLAGVSNTSSVTARKLNRGKRRIWRLHGAVVCHNCLRTALKQSVRSV